MSFRVTTTSHASLNVFTRLTSHKGDATEHSSEVNRIFAACGSAKKRFRRNKSHKLSWKCVFGHKISKEDPISLKLHFTKSLTFVSKLCLAQAGVSWEQVCEVISHEWTSGASLEWENSLYEQFSDGFKSQDDTLQVYGKYCKELRGANQLSGWSAITCIGHRRPSAWSRKHSASITHYSLLPTHGKV